MDARGGLAVGAALLAAALLARWISAPPSGVPVAAAAGPVAQVELGPARTELREPALELQTQLPSREPVESAAPTPEVDQSLDPLQLIDPSELPPDPTQSGPASLTLRLVDTRTGEPLASGVELWRVAAPENEDWSAGDQLQATVDVPQGGARLADLPEGRYRAACACAATSQEPPEFEVRAPHTAIELQLELPLEFELRVHFVDRFGEPYASVDWWTESWHSIEPPSAARTARAPRHLQGMVWGHASFGFGGAKDAQQVAQSADGILLGRHGASSRQRGLRPVLRLRAPDGALGEVVVPARGEGVVRLVIVGLPADVAASRVRLPDGRPSAAVVEALGLAQPCTDPEREWRDAPVRLKAELEGFASVEVAWRASDGELPWILLQAAE